VNCISLFENLSDYIIKVINTILWGGGGRGTERERERERERENIIYNICILIMKCICYIKINWFSNKNSVIHKKWYEIDNFEKKSPVN